VTHDYLVKKKVMFREKKMKWRDLNPEKIKARFLLALRRKSPPCREAYPPGKQGSGNPARSCDANPACAGVDERFNFISLVGPQATEHL